MTGDKQLVHTYLSLSAVIHNRAAVDRRSGGQGGAGIGFDDRKLWLEVP